MAILNFRLSFPTQAQIQSMAGAGVTISTVAFPSVDDVQIETNDVTEGYDSRIAEGISAYGWAYIGES